MFSASELNQKEPTDMSLRHSLDIIVARQNFKSQLNLEITPIPLQFLATNSWLLILGPTFLFFFNFVVDGSALANK